MSLRGARDKLAGCEPFYLLRCRWIFSFLLLPSRVMERRVASPIVLRDARFGRKFRGYVSGDKFSKLSFPIRIDKNRFGDPDGGRPAFSIFYLAIINIVDLS